ncbi:putative RDD family membrane protein YckC [Rhizobium sp. SG_E_25_P2]|uniref:RDD family protein n=1 Tax=Rhizobium sp. SG_E_25_P2 TaxID=2879942 RepID=UPI002474ED68|nr:RDD family protein [Rhizobium sp. SG_E_25_P2]MDH6267209.1 putative RDD family membrane protein YckC [Rhizobium sp. SG_E_25_P2]
MDDAVFPKRHFLRRGAAFVLDCLIASVLAGLVLLPLSIVAGVDLGASSAATKAVCAPAPPQLPALRSIEAALPLREGEMRAASLCVISILGLEDQTYLSVTHVSGSSNGSDGLTYGVMNSRTLTVGVDDRGEAFTTAPAPSIAIPLTILILAFFIAGGKRGPGKWLMSLRVTTDDDGPLAYRRALKRESLKLLPALCIFAWQLVVFLEYWVAGAQGADAVPAWTEPSVSLIATAILFQVFTIVWFFGPFIVWRGKTFHDRFAGTKLAIAGRG